MTQPIHRARHVASASPPALETRGRLEPEDVVLLGERLREIAGGRSGRPVRCDVHAITQPDIGTVGALAELGLLSRRLGCRLQLAGTRQELLELIELAGLDGLAVEVIREPEEREVALGVEKERDRGDSIA
ncbi:MAG TPA: STAS domain-containing protein [Candidatus Limnocylindrales bacterium]|nr:STAS domain-containing protein [Candidatus Limnocylindrales bacterium]